TAPVAMTRVGLLAPISLAMAKLVALAKPFDAHQAVAAPAPQPTPQFWHQSSRLGPCIGLLNVCVGSGRVQVMWLKPSQNAWSQTAPVAMTRVGLLAPISLAMAKLTAFV